ncbi:MAG: hypothetical protein J1F23_06630 [Oscillospiraceae bacterium]|nr:hypothetical protein [Oscillospiraceae bacterium]
MAKKQLTPEEYKAKLEKKADKSKRFGAAFVKAFALFLACAIVFCASNIAFTRVSLANGTTSTAGGNTQNTGNTSNNGNDGVDWGDNTTLGDDVQTPADDNNGDPSNDGQPSGGDQTPSTPDNGNQGSGNQGDNGSGGNNATSGDNKALSNSSSAAEVVSYFNTAINKVKPNAKQITLKREVNSSAGEIDGNLPKTLSGMADSLISGNMGEKDLSTLDPGMVNATTVAQKNAMFPVENESWSSKLTADDVAKFDVKDNGKSYVITLYIKEDAPSASTAHGVGHAGKVFSVIMPNIVTDNAGPAASIIKDVQTGHKNGYVKVAVDKDTGNVTQATYYFEWTLSLKALGISLSIPFGLQKDFTIAW